MAENTETLFSEYFSRLESEARTSAQKAIDHVTAVANWLMRDTSAFMAEARKAHDAMKAGAGSKTQADFWSRAYVRALFWQIEGTCSIFRQAACWARERGEYQPNTGETAILDEVEYFWSKDKLATKAKPLSITDAVPASFHLFAAANGTPFSIDFTDYGWKSFLAANQFRDRITHPRTHQDYEIKWPDEIFAINNTGLWFTDRFIALLAACGKADVVDAIASKKTTPRYKEIKIIEKGRLLKGRNTLDIFTALDKRSRMAHFQLMNSALGQDTMEALQICNETSRAMNNRHQGQVTSPEEFFADLFTMYSRSRLLLTSFFSSVDGICATLCRMALWAHEAKEHELEFGFEALLREKRYYFDKNVLKSADQFNSFERNLDLAFELFPKTHGFSFKIDKSRVGWRNFKTAMELRHRVTHPKDPGDLFEDSSWLLDVQRAVVWFNETIQEMIHLWAEKEGITLEN